MERLEFVAVLTPLVVGMRADFDAPTWTAYYRALEDVPVKLLEAAVDTSLRAQSPFMPKPGELRALADIRRKELLAAHPWERCAECHHVGLISAGLDEKRRPIYRKCRCWDRYQERLALMGLGTEPLALPPADFTQVSE